MPTTELLFPKTINTRVHWTIGSARDDQTDYLPHYDLVFNAMSDADMEGGSAETVRRFTRSVHQTAAQPPR